jgi:hypothetical protein
MQEILIDGREFVLQRPIQKIQYFGIAAHGRPSLSKHCAAPDTAPRQAR